MVPTSLTVNQDVVGHEITALPLQSERQLLLTAVAEIQTCETCTGIDFTLFKLRVCDEWQNGHCDDC